MLAAVLTLLLLPTPPPQQGSGIPEFPSLVGAERGSAQRQIEDRLNAGIYLRSPWIARERGSTEVELTLGMFGIAGRDVWRQYVDQRRAEFGTIGIPRDEPLARIEWNWINGWFDAQSILTRTRAIEQIDPLEFVRRAERTLSALVETERPSKEERVLELDGVLTALPDYWREARRSLVNPRRLFAESAVAELPALETWMAAIPEAFDDITWDPTFELLFEQHLRRAVRSTTEFREWLEDGLLDMENYQGSLDRLRWEALASATTGRTVDAEQLHARVLRETADLLMTLPTRDEFEPAGTEALGRALVAGSREGWELASGAGLFRGELAVRLDPEFATVRGGSTPLARLANPRNDSIELHQAISDPGGPIHPGAHPWRRTEAGQRVLGLRHGAIGEAWLVATYVRQAPAGDRLWNEYTLGGLGLYATDWALRLGGEENALAQDEELLRASLEVRIEEALLLLAAIELHALELSLGRVAESLAHRGGISRESAAFLAEEVLRDPLSGMAFLGYETLRRWEDSLRLGRSLTEALEHVYATIEAHPTALLDDLRIAYPGRKGR